MAIWKPQTQRTYWTLQNPFAHLHGTKLCQVLHTPFHSTKTNVGIWKDGRVFKFKLKAESKNYISGVRDPCRGVRKLLYILLRVDSQLTELTIDEYEGLRVISSAFSLLHNTTDCH